MKKLFSIILAILMIVTTIPFAFAAEDGFVEVSTEAEMVAALENGGNIMLTGDITVSDEYWGGYEITKIPPLTSTDILLPVCMYSLQILKTQV